MITAIRILSAAALLLLSALLPAGAAAQRVYSPEFYIGGHAGATVSQMSFSPGIQQSMKPGMMIGVTARYTEENHFGIIAELNLQQRGWAESYDPNAHGFSYSRTLTYLQLPLLTHIYFGNRRLRGFFNAGPEVAYMISNKISANFNYADIAAVEGYPTHNRTNEQLDMAVSNRFDYGISAGAGMEWFVAPRHSLTLEGRFYYGLANIFPSSKRDVFNASRGWSIEATIGYNFRLK